MTKAKLRDMGLVLLIAAAIIGTAYRATGADTAISQLRQSPCVMLPYVGCRGR